MASDEEAGRPAIPYGRQQVDERDVEAVVDVLRSDWLTTGPQVPAFEAALCAQTGARHAAVVSSGTAALHCAYFAAGVGPGEQVLTSPLTFAATASTALLLGADVAFADVDPATGLLDPAAARAALTPNTRLIVPVDYAGQPADASAFEALASARGARVVIDAAHSLGAARDGRRVGEMGDASTLSFHPVKPITSAEGGAVLCRDASLDAAVRRFRNHGIERDPARHEAPDGAWHYEIREPGLNYRLPDVLCALGRSQLARLERFLGRRRALAATWLEGLADVDGLELPVVDAGCEPGWHLFVVRVREAARRRVFFDALRAAGLGVQVHYEALHLQPYLRARGFAAGDFPHAEDFAARALSLPIFPGLDDAGAARSVDTVRAVAAALL